MALDCVPLPQPNTKDTGFYFWNGKTSRELAVEMAERLLRSVFRQAEVPNAHAHRFHHTIAAEILAKGGTMQDVADVLGIGIQIAQKHYAKWDHSRQQ